MGIYGCNGMDSLVFTDSSKINFDIYRAILFSHFQSALSWQCISREATQNLVMSI